MNHLQGCDSIASAGPGRLLVTGDDNKITMLDATDGREQGATETLPFSVYSVSHADGFVAVCGRVVQAPPRLDAKAPPGFKGSTYTWY